MDDTTKAETFLEWVLGACDRLLLEREAQVSAISDDQNAHLAQPVEIAEPASPQI